MKKLGMSIFLGLMAVTVFVNEANAQSEHLLILNQLDWDITRPGPIGRKYRNAAVRKLQCGGQYDEELREAIIIRMVRLLNHESPFVTMAAQNVLNFFEVPQERIAASLPNEILIFGYLGKFNEERWRNLVKLILEKRPQVLEIEETNYPTADVVRELNNFIYEIRPLVPVNFSIRLRIGNFSAPSDTDQWAINQIAVPVTLDLLTGSRLDDREFCPSHESP